MTIDAPPRPPTSRAEREVARMRSFRSVDSVWLPAKDAAEQRGENLSDVLNAALKRYATRARKDAQTAAEAAADTPA